jgi:alpha-L-arabinofuranosidase
MAALPELLQYQPTAHTHTAELLVDASQRDAEPVNRRLLGKFCEHLGANINQGMEAQILHNPTLARWRFSAGDDHPDGGVREEGDRGRIEARIRAHAARQGWPDAEPLIDGYFGGGAYGWFRLGADGRVVLGAEVGAHGGRAQRVEVGEGAGMAGIGQWIYLPLHRVRVYEYRIVARAVGGAVLRLGLQPATSTAGLPEPASATVELSDQWQTSCGRLTLPDDAPAEALYRAAVTVTGEAHLEVDRVLLYPADHVRGADPEVIALLREARLPVLRWPGGNFVSGYRWRDGVGPVDARPTVPNPAWEGLEFNLFGTDEFISFCGAVDCEPVICVNAGDGSAEEAADWVEYCNGSADSPMGQLRAANGHPEPYAVRCWEIGNEVHGGWQVGWTTAAGNLDRFRRFRAAMLAADPDLDLIGCGHGNEPLSEWNQQLISGAGNTLRCISDHILTGGSVGSETDAVELYHAFMGYATVLQQRYQSLREHMEAAGIKAPRLAITELQLFAHYRGDAPAADGSAPANPQSPDHRLKPGQMPSPDTLAEALSLATILNTCIRLGDFVELLTHSATVNHGGGLRKQHERVFANPVHYAHLLAAAMAGGTPVPLRLACGAFSTQNHFAHIPPLTGVPYLDPMAVVTAAGELVLLIVHRGGDCGPIELSIRLQGFSSSGQAHLTRLSADNWWARNTLTEPEQVAPQSEELAPPESGALQLTVPPFSLLRLVLDPA